MAYTKHTWAENEIIDHAKLNNIENGVAANDSAASSLDGRLDDAEDAIDTIEETLQNVKAFFDAVHPVGCIYLSTASQSPAQMGISNGTWVAIEGRFLLAQDSSHAAGSTSGEETHTLTVQEMPSHNHEKLRLRWDTNPGAFAVYGSNGSGTGSAYDSESYQGGGQAHNNMPPYLAVYCWKRTA